MAGPGGQSLGHDDTFDQAPTPSPSGPVHGVRARRARRAGPGGEAADTGQPARGGRVLPDLGERAPHPRRGRRPKDLTRTSLPDLVPAMTTGADTGPARERVCAVLLHDGRLALIRRQPSAGVQHSLPGGLVEDGEDPATALRRELLEELGLDLGALPEPPVLRFVQEQETQRPGGTTLFRRRHLVFTAHLPDHLHRTVAVIEQDDPGRAPVKWLPLAAAASLHLYPAVGPVLEQAARAEPSGGPLLLLPMTDLTYRWR